MSVELSLKGAPGLLVIVGERNVGHTWRVAIVRDDEWFRVYRHRDVVGWNLFLTAFRCCLMVERWVWTK